MYEIGPDADSIAVRILEELRRAIPEGLPVHRVAIRTGTTYIDTLALLDWLDRHGYVRTDKRGWRHARRRAPIRYYLCPRGWLGLEGPCPESLYKPLPPPPAL